MNRGGVFVDVMGDEFAELSPALRMFHSLEGRYRFEGRVTVLPAGSQAARLFAWIARTPLACADAPFAFELFASTTSQTWIRHFPDRRMRSVLTMRSVRNRRFLIERLSLATFRLLPRASQGALHLDLVAFSVLGLVMPRWACPRVRAIETEAGGHRIAFDVDAALPVLGRIVAYRGWLDIGLLE